MDEYSGKRRAGGYMAPRNGQGVAFKDAGASRNGNAQDCNRIGCSGKLKYGLNTKTGSSDKAKESQPAVRSSNGSEITRSSSKSGPMVAGAKKSYMDSKRKLSSQLAFDASKSSLSSESGTPVSPPNRNQTGYRSESMKKSGKFTVIEVGSSSVSSNVGPRKIFNQRSGSNNQNVPPASSVPLASKCSTLRPPSSSNGSRNGLRNMKCNSISDVLPSNCSSSDSKSVGKNVMKNKSPEGESSLPRGERKTTPTSTLYRHASPSTSGISISDSNRSSSSGENKSAAASVRTRRSMNINTGIRPSYRPNGRDRLSFREPVSGISQMRNNGVPLNVGGQSSSRHFSAIGSSSGTSSYSLSSSDSDNPSAALTSTDFSFSHLMNHDAFYRYNMDGVAEVLLALERNEDLTREQLIALDTSLFLSSLSLYDQHRDMRLDIDNMSYEELLALEEKMGTVSTALPEEALFKCLKRDTYRVTPSEVRVMGSGDNGDDTKCSICQEDYEIGDEIGKLVGCQHGYHETCIVQWLQLKNWCPICKASAATSKLPSS